MARRGYSWSDLVGQRFGRLAPIRCVPTKRGGKSSKWECLCDCGRTTLANACTLKSGGVRSCGCLKQEQSRKWCSTGNGPRRVLPFGVAALKKVLYVYQKHAIDRGLVWDLEVTQSVRLFKSKCHYCGVAPSNVQTGSPDCGDFIYSGIDRMDNSLGYTLNNCVPCCRQCNFAKAAMSYEDFTAWLDRIAEYRVNQARERVVA